MNVSDDLIFNILQDFRKKDIHPIDRAKFIDEYLTYKNMSQRQLAKKLGIPHSTIQDWLQYKKLNKEQYDKLTNKGHTKKEIYRMVRDDRANAEEKIKTAIETPEINRVLESVTSVLRPYIRQIDTDTNTLILMNELRNILNRIEMRMEMKNDRY